MMNMLSPQAMSGGATPTATPPVPSPNPPNSGQNAPGGQPVLQTPLQIGQMPMQGENPIYQMPGQMPGGLGGGMMGQFGGFPNALMNWMQQRPQGGWMHPGDQQSQDQAMQAWRQARPTMSSFFPRVGAPGAPGVMPINQGGQMTPGGGGTGAPLQGNPAFQPPSQPPPQQVGTQMGVIGATPAINGFGLPSY